MLISLSLHENGCVLSRRDYVNKCTEMCTRMICVAITLNPLPAVHAPFFLDHQSPVLSGRAWNVVVRWAACGEVIAWD